MILASPMIRYSCKHIDPHECPPLLGRLGEKAEGLRRRAGSDLLSAIEQALNGEKYLSPNLSPPDLSNLPSIR